MKNNIKLIDEYLGVSVYVDHYIEDDHVIIGRKDTHSLDPGLIQINTDDFNEALEKISYNNDNRFFTSKKYHINLWKNKEFSFILVNKNFGIEKYKLLIENVIKTILNEE